MVAVEIARDQGRRLLPGNGVWTSGRGGEPAGTITQQYRDGRPRRKIVRHGKVEFAVAIEVASDDRGRTGARSRDGRRRPEAPHAVSQEHRYGCTAGAVGHR